MVCRTCMLTWLPPEPSGRHVGSAGGFPLIGEENDLRLAIEQTTARLQQEMGGRVPEATIAACVNTALDEFRDARVKTYVPVLTYRVARERLSQLLDTRN
jgi:hypothetical protein